MLGWVLVVGACNNPPIPKGRPDTLSPVSEVNSRARSPTDLKDEVATPSSIAPWSKEWFVGGAFTYGSACTFRPPGMPQSKEVRFRCGVIAIGLTADLQTQALIDLIATLGGRIARHERSRIAPTAVIEVPVGSELQTILALFESGTIRYAELSRVTPGAVGTERLPASQSP